MCAEYECVNEQLIYDLIHVWMCTLVMYVYVRSY